MASSRDATVFTDERILSEALTAYPKYDGKLSPTDVISTIVMRRVMR
jgi:hypothetical protein